MRKDKDKRHDTAEADELIRLTEELERRNAALEAQLREQDRNRAALLHLLEELERERGLIAQGRREWVTALDAVQDPIFIHDNDMRVIRANRAYAALAGLDVREVIGKTYWQLFPKLDGPLAGCRRAMEGRTEQEEEIHLDNGRDYISRSYPIHGANNDYLYSLHVLQDVTARRKAEAEQRVLSEAMRQAAEAVLVLDAEAHIAYLNPAFYRLFGYAPGEILGRPIMSLAVSGDDEALQPAAVVAALREHGQWKGEVRRRARDGTAIPVLLSASVIRDDKDEITGYVGTFLDLREIKRAEQALAESEEKFRSISATALDAVLVIDNDGKLVYWNSAAERIFGHPAQEALGQHLHRLLAPSRYHADIERGFALFRETGTGPVIGKTLELEARRKDGSEFPIELSISAFKLKDRWHAVGILRDVTARKQAEAELRLFRALLDNSNDAVEVIDADTLRFLDVNEKECRVLGYSREELLSMRVPDIDSAFGSASMKMLDEQIRKSGAALFESLHRRKDGSTFPVEVSLKFVEIGGKTYVLGIARDITERKQMEDALRRSNRALKTLSAGNAALVHAQSESKLLQQICHVIVETGGYAYAWIGYAANDAERRIRPMAQEGFEPGFLEALPLSMQGQDPCDTAVREGVVVVARDADHDPALAERRDLIARLGIGSIASFPLLSGDEAFGMLSIYSRERDAFDRDELMLLAEMVEDLNFGILTLRARVEHERLQEEHLKTAERLKETLAGTIRAIALTVEKRDPYTAGHQQKVSELCVAIGRELGLPEERLEGLRLGATIHDIGKVYVPAEILSRPGKLTGPEFEIIKSHPEVGYDIVKDVKSPWPVGEMILQHHERLDGSGYPKGLKGEEIILEARILAVADTIEAMASHRPYRPAHGVDAALEEIERHRGDWYDPAVVDACLRLFREKRFALG